MSDFVIVLPTHSDYIDITEIFLKLFKKNWPNCPYSVVVSIVGDDVKLDNVTTIYNGENASLVDCLVNVTTKFKSKYYISMLGDAFISKLVDDVKVNKLFGVILDNNFEYCSLQNVKNYKKEKCFDKYFRYINNLDRYSHNFTAFVVSRKYLEKDFAKFKSDLDFEKAFLSPKKNFYFESHFAVRDNYFNLMPSIVKGKWDKMNLSKLKRENPEIEFGERQVHSLKDSLIYHVRNGIVSYIPRSWRVAIKTGAEKAFRINFGING